jgi:hypothetical protein
MTEGHDSKNGKWLKDVALRELEFYRAQALQNQNLIFYSALAIFLSSTTVPIITKLIAKSSVNAPAGDTVSVGDKISLVFHVVILISFLVSVALPWIFILLQAYHVGSKKTERPSLASELKSIIEKKFDSADKDASNDGIITKFNETCLAQISLYQRIISLRQKYQRWTVYSIAFSLFMFVFSLYYFSSVGSIK